MKKKYICTECGKDVSREVAYGGGWKKGKKIITKKGELLCRKCFKERTGIVIF